MDICITGTGFRGSAREDIRRLAELLGMEYNGALVRDCTTHLILASEALLCEDIPRSQKLDSAKCWGIALTHYAWLKDSLAMGKILDAQKYIVQNSPDRCVLHGRGVHSDAWTPEKLRAAQISPAQRYRCDQFWSPGQASKGPGDENAQSSGHSARNSERSMGRTVANAIPSVQDLCLSSATVNEERCSKEVCTQCAVPPGTACSKSYSESGQSYTVSEGYGQPSPEIMRISVDAPLKVCPKGSTAAAFHGVSNRSLTYYEKLTIQQSSSSPPLNFDLQERTHGALVYYEDSKSGEHELAYADILYCYSLEGGEVYIEHGYLFDRDDLEQHAMGRFFLESFQVADAELVDSSGVYHSPAAVIEGEFWLTSRGKAELSAHDRSQDQERLLFFCEKAWERRTGRGICVSRYKLKSRKQFIRG